MPDDRDEYIEIDLGDDDETGSPSDVLDLTLDDVSAPAAKQASAPPRPRHPSPTPPTAEPAASGLPMTSTGVCARCGYALRPLEDVCPRCKQSVIEPVEKPVEKSAPQAAEASDAPLPPVEATASPHRGCSLFAIAGTIAFLALAVGIPLYLWMQPAQRAKREYQAGLQAQLRGDFEGARAHYQMALSLDPDMGLAAFSMGTTYLHIGDPAMMKSVEELTQKAVSGQTRELDEADKWFTQAATIGQRIPASTRLMDQKISSPARLRAFARACLAITALIRASAAMQAEQLDDAMAWFQVSTQQAQTAIVDDPSNDSANQVLRAIPPVTPGTTTPPQS